MSWYIYFIKGKNGQDTVVSLELLKQTFSLLIHSWFAPQQFSIMISYSLQDVL